MTIPHCTASMRHRWFRDASVGVAENPGGTSLPGNRVAIVDRCAHCQTQREEITDLRTRRARVRYLK